MNSSERRELRYRRRCEKRNKKIDRRCELFSDVNKCFTFSKVMYYADKCCNGVRWKKSTITFILHEFTIIATTCHNIKNNSYKVGETYKFRINERGKVRDIDAPHIRDRLIHKVLSNEIILPIYYPHLIYDNGASMYNKGFIFAINRVKSKLRKYYNLYGNDLYIILIDFSSFFLNCNHDVIHAIHKKYIKNDYTIKVIEDYLFVNENGIALGIEIAQREASIIPNVLDHYLSNNSLFVERYMDDTICLVSSYSEALNLLKRYKEMCKSYGIVINENKTKIIKSNKLIYCKWKYILGNKIKNIPVKSTIYRQRRILRRMKRKGIDSSLSINSYISYLNIGHSYKYVMYLRDANEKNWLK